MVISIVSQMILAFFLLEKVLASYFFGLLELGVARWGFGQWNVNSGIFFFFF